MINLILFGPPGSGKGTQAFKIAEKYNLVHISTGDLFRYEIGNNTELGKEASSYMAKGELVPDSITIGMLNNKMKMHPEASGFIFDGFPRNISQAKALDKLMAESDLQIDLLISLHVDEEEIVKRILLRGENSGRPDDNDQDIIRNRILVYKNETTPVYDYYFEKKISKTINGIGSIDEIFEQICQTIEQAS